MSFSEVTVLKFLGEKATRVCDFIEASESTIGRFSLKDIKKTRLKDLHFFLNDIYRDWKDASMVYSSRYTDNDSVYGSQIKNMRKILETVEGLELKELTTNKCFVLLVKFNKKFLLSELVKLKRLKKYPLNPLREDCILIYVRLV